MSLTLTENKIGAIAYDIYVDGELLETVDEENAIEYMHGWDNIVPGLEKALAGKQAGDSFDVTVAPADAYGEYDNDMIEEIPADDFDFEEEGVALEPGLEVEMMDEDGDIIEGTILGIEGDMVLVDLNPPLAGKTIRYAGQILNVREPSEEEMDWGFPESLLDEMFGEEEDEDDE